jgi:dsDNA-specific endonuclease/ATPase MutS2
MRQKSYIEIDFHGYSVEDALRAVESIINEIRMNNDSETCYFITGHGRIRTAIYDMLRDTYELEPVIPLANAGVVTVYIY